MDRRAVLTLILAGVGESCTSPPLAPAVGDRRFDAWMAGFADRAVAAGLPAEAVRRELAGLGPDPRVLALDADQPEFAWPIGDYVNGLITGPRVRGGRRRAASPRLAAIQSRYGVPGEILLAVWARESDFGVSQGEFDIVRALATLAADGRRRAWAERELVAAIRILDGRGAARARRRGSFTGAMGQTQLEPTVYLASGVAGEGGDRPDVWGSAADALASTANVLAKAGWRAGQAWDREVRLPPGFDYGLCETARRSTAAWAALGIVPADGGGWRASEASDDASVIVPAGAAGPALLVLPNHFVIRRYNNAIAYALAVGLLADRIGGGPALAAAWPPETPMPLAVRRAAQAALARLGYDPGPATGRIGADTRQALRTWQKARNLIPDGYLTPSLAARLQAEATSAPQA